VGPEHSWLASTERARYETVTDAEALKAFSALASSEGILPALESSHALAYALRGDLSGETLLIGLSGRGDKDVATIAEALAK
jgi:tryptophan synthase beta chain